MGNQASVDVDRRLPPDERIIGLHNFGYTCYANSVVQALYFCVPFREQLVQRRQRFKDREELRRNNDLRDIHVAQNGKNIANKNINSDSWYRYISRGFGGKGNSSERISSGVLSDMVIKTPQGERSTSSINSSPTIVSALSDLFDTIMSHKNRQGTIFPKEFMRVLHDSNGLFKGSQQQDAHEFLNFLLNNIAESTQKEPYRKSGIKSNNGTSCNTSIAKTSSEHCVNGANYNDGSPHDISVGSNRSGSASNFAASDRSWVHDIFQGVLANETKCLSCESVTSREESFLDLSLEISPNCSLSSCLRQFSAIETLRANDKFYCDVCCSLQEAQRRMCIKKLPHCLAIQLKRFKYMEDDRRHKKLLYRVLFPMELKIASTGSGNGSEDREDDKEYSLFAVVVHVGAGPSQGHYVTLVKCHTLWLRFDDDIVREISESDIHAVFGCSDEGNTHRDRTSDVSTDRSRLASETGYILFYQQNLPL